MLTSFPPSARLISNSAQFSMTVYSAEIATQSVPLVIALGILILGFSAVEMLIDVVAPPERQHGQTESKADVKCMAGIEDSIKSGSGGVELTTAYEKSANQIWEGVQVEEMRTCCGY